MICGVLFSVRELLPKSPEIKVVKITHSRVHTRTTEPFLCGLIRPSATDCWRLGEPVGGSEKGRYLAHFPTHIAGIAAGKWRFRRDRPLI